MSIHSEDIIIELGQKLGDRHIDQLIDEFLKKFRAVDQKSARFIFDFSKIQWISNQELLVLTGLFKYLYSSNVAFKVQFRSKEIDARKAIQFIQIWDVWKIYRIIPDKDFGQYFDIDARYVDYLKEKFKIRSNNQEIYERYGVTPFLELEWIQNYEDKRIGELIDSMYRLSHATNEILVKHNCFVPIQNRTLGAIITKELYENFLDHITKSIFESTKQFAFMSLSLSKRFDESKNDANKIQRLLKLNFEEEQVEDFRDFFYNESSKQFINQSRLELSFLDFGDGIPKTLEKSYKENDLTSFSESHFKQNVDTRILEYAFRFDSSRFPIHKRYSEKLVLPRGLFDLLSIVKRFEGLLVARSNYGKIAYDFSKKKSFEDAVIYFGDGELSFPGTLISIYLPERSLKTTFDTSKIKPIEVMDSRAFKRQSTKFISIYDILTRLRSTTTVKANLYDSLLEILSKEFSNENKRGLIYLDFDGYEIDERVSKKILYFLISDYRVNLKNNVIIINPPPKSYLDIVQKELLDLTDIDKQFKIHPTPFVYLNESKWEIDIFWLGVFSEPDIRKLNNLLLDDHDLRKSDFERPEDVIGHINYYDEYGNLKSFINSTEIVKIYKDKVIESRKSHSKELIEKYIKRFDNAIFLCNGNYYQETYVQLFDALSKNEECIHLTKSLYNTIKESVPDVAKFKFLSITASSQKIIESFISLGYIEASQTITLDSYHGFIDEPQFEQKIKANDSVILVCDVVSTGYMIKQVEKGLDIRGASLAQVAVLVNAIDKEFEKNSFRYNELKVKISSLLLLPIKKFRRATIKDQLVKGNLKVIRVNPFTNTPITDSIKNSNYNESVLLSNQEFIDAIEPENIKVGYYRFNNLIHPYFFHTEDILSNDESSAKLLEAIFNKFDRTTREEIDIIFYPKNSGIKFLNTNILSDKILLNQAVRILELERFSTSEGWRFPHPPEYMRDISIGKTVMILDDGSCTGDSIIQMIDEVAFLNVKKIIVLTLIGRVNSHKREFFSRIDSIRNFNSTVDLKIFFGSHWNIPTYYIEDSPVISEKRWLEDVKRFPNTPTRIKDIAKKVLNELEPKDVSTGNNKYLLKDKGGKEINKDVIVVREEIGKITSYRFYEEYFSFFNNVVSKYESTERSSDRYKVIELICAVFLHEPYLFDRFKNVMPDLVDKIEEFILTLTVGNPNRGGKRLEKSNLYYDWKNKDILHLFFIVFKDMRLIEVLDTDKLTTIIHHFGKQHSDLNYIFFKLARYMPLNAEVITEKKYSGKIIQLIESVKGKVTEQSQKNQLKIFTSFISTLPYRDDDFDSHIGKIKSNYNKLKEDQHHNEYIFNDKQVLVAQLTVLLKKKLNNQPFDEEKASILNAWSNTALFVEDLLRFSASYPNFFAPIKDKLNKEQEPYSLREIYGKLQEMIYSDDFPNPEEAITLLNKLFSYFIMDASIYPTIFNDTVTTNLKEIFEESFKDLSNLKLKVSGLLPQNVGVNLPTVYLKEIVFKEIRENFRHADSRHEIEFTWRIQNGFVSLSVKNAAMNNTEKRGGGKGIERLNRLNHFPISTSYDSRQENEYFNQTLKFKKL